MLTFYPEFDADFDPQQEVVICHVFMAYVYLFVICHVFMNTCLFTCNLYCVYENMFIYMYFARCVLTCLFTCNLSCVYIHIFIYL